MSEPTGTPPAAVVAGGGSQVVDPTMTESAENRGDGNGESCEEMDAEDSSYYLVKPKAKKVGINLATRVPDPGTYQFYVESLSLVQLGSAECEELVDAKKKQDHPKVKWMATHKAAYEYLSKKGCPQSKAEQGQEMWMVHQASKQFKQNFSKSGLPTVPSKGHLKIDGHDASRGEEEYYFIGRKIEADSDFAVALLIVTVESELWLKSSQKQNAMYNKLVTDVGRACPNSFVTRCGVVLHIRVQRPTNMELDFCALIPGVHQVGLPDSETKVNLGGEILRTGPGGVPQLNNHQNEQPERMPAEEEQTKPALGRSEAKVGSKRDATCKDDENATGEDNKKEEEPEAKRRRLEELEEQMAKEFPEVSKGRCSVCQCDGVPADRVRMHVTGKKHTAKLNSALKAAQAASSSTPTTAPPVAPLL